MAPVTGSLILLILFSAGTLADNNDKPIPPPPPEKPGKCPQFNALIKCVTPLPRGECNLDKDCDGNLKCCRNLCTPTCMKPVPDVKPGTCPPPRTRCPGPPTPGNCKVDADCKGVKKCCEKDCKLECNNFKAKKIADKSWSCPAFNTLLPCETHPTECSGDSECPGNEKCCDYGCKWQCIPRP